MTTEQFPMSPPSLPPSSHCPLHSKNSVCSVCQHSLVDVTAGASGVSSRAPILPGFPYLIISRHSRSVCTSVYVSLPDKFATPKLQNQTTFVQILAGKWQLMTSCVRFGHLSSKLNVGLMTTFTPKYLTVSLDNPERCRVAPRRG